MDNDGLTCTDQSTLLLVMKLDKVYEELPPVLILKIQFIYYYHN
jgi:hypothetical protein